MVYLVLMLLVSLDAVAQDNLYTQKVEEGEKLFWSGKYTKSAKCYSKAFQSFGWRGFLPDRLNAARAWSMAGKPDSAYFSLFRIAERLNYGNLEELKTDKHLKPLHSDTRWKVLCDLVEKNSRSYRNKADEGKRLLNTGRYAEAAKCYFDAFQSNDWKGYLNDRLNAARAWSMAGVLDSAYFNLLRVAEQVDYGNEDATYSEGADAPNLYIYFWDELHTDPMLEPLRSDARWPGLCDRAKANLPDMPEQARILEAVLTQDQSLRVKTDQVRNEFGSNSKEVTNHIQQMRVQDSLNQVIVTGLLETHGWLGEKSVGRKGNSAIFLVVQHAPLPVQEKYLPMMQEAVRTGNAKGSQLALLEDRILIRNGKKQVYGSQVTKDPVTNEMHFYAIEDVDQVDQRRAAAGLGPLAEYARHFGFTWDAEAIEKNKKMIPALPEHK